MEFNWDDFTEEDFVNYCAIIENGKMFDNDCMGCVRIGDLCFDENGKCYAAGVTIKKYMHKSSAVRAAKKRFGVDDSVEWLVSQENPWCICEYYRDRDKFPIQRSD